MSNETPSRTDPDAPSVDAAAGPARREQAARTRGARERQERLERALPTMNEWPPSAGVESSPPNEKGDTDEIAAWRARMDTDEAKALCKQRAATVECNNAWTPHHGLSRFKL